MRKWMILYTDERIIHGEGTPQLPLDRTIGVHSVYQEIDGAKMREGLAGSAFYGWHIPTGAWMPMEQSDLEDYRTNLPSELGPVVDGRAQTTEEFWRLRKFVEADPYLIGAVRRSATRG